MGDFVNILALDTAMSGCSAAVVAGEQVAVRSEAMPRGQAEHLVPFAQGAMDECALDYEALDAVVCTIGPGAFTGLRIGMSTAKAFALSLDIPLYGITTLQALALKYVEDHSGPCTVVIETKRQDFYIQQFDAKGGALEAPQALQVDDVEGLLDPSSVLIGDAIERLLEAAPDYNGPVNEEYSLPDVALMAQICRDPDVCEKFFTSDVQPVYLREADVSRSKKIQRPLAV